MNKLNIDLTDFRITVQHVEVLIIGVIATIIGNLLSKASLCLWKAANRLFYYLDARVRCSDVRINWSTRALIPYILLLSPYVAIICVMISRYGFWNIIAIAPLVILLGGMMAHLNVVVSKI